MNFNMSVVSSAISTAASSAISTVSPYLPALCHLDPSSTTLTGNEKLMNYAALAISTFGITSNLFWAVSSRNNLKQVAVHLGVSAISAANLVAVYMNMNSTPFGDVDSATANFTNSTPS